MSSQQEPENRKPGAQTRQDEILELVSVQGFMSTDALAKRLNVTTQTIRADINRLCRDGKLRRHHGGAGLASTLDNATFAKRRLLLREEKNLIAAAIAKRIPNNASLCIHYGTTMEAVAAALQGHSGLLIITNNISAIAFAPQDGKSRVMLAGGDFNPKEQSTTGEAATMFMRQFNVDFGLLSAGCIGSDGTLFEYDYEAAQSARVILEHAREVFVAVDHRKFDRQGLIKFGHVREISALFTDCSPPDSLTKVLTDLTVELHVVPTNR